LNYTVLCSGAGGAAHPKHWLTPLFGRTVWLGGHHAVAAVRNAHLQPAIDDGACGCMEAPAVWWEQPGCRVGGSRWQSGWAGSHEPRSSPSGRLSRTTNSAQVTSCHISCATLARRRSGGTPRGSGRLSNTHGPPTRVPRRPTALRVPSRGRPSPWIETVFQSNARGWKRPCVPSSFVSVRRVIPRRRASWRGLSLAVAGFSPVCGLLAHRRWR